MEYKYDDLVATLNKNKAKIVFRKVDGTLREMEVTRNLGMIPEDSRPKGDNQSDPVKFDERGERIIPTTVKVYSFGDLAWRSFKVDSLKSIEIIS